MKGNDKMNDSIDFLPYGSNNLYYVKGNNGFVTEDGLFYKAGKIEYYDDVCDYYSKCLIKAIYNEDITKKYKVIEMVQPIIKIYFEDEDGDKSYKFVPGICKFYV